MAVKKRVAPKFKPGTLVRYNFHNSQHTGKAGAQHGQMLDITPTTHFAGEKAVIRRNVAGVRKASKPIVGTSHIRAFKHK